MNRLSEARRTVLRQFIKNNGGYRAVRKKFGLTPSLMSYLSQLVGKGSRAPFGERSARNWEIRLSIPGNALVEPGPMATGIGALPDIAAAISNLGEILNAIPHEERSCVAPLLEIFAKNPLAEIEVALVAVLKDCANEINT